jgi:p-cumate 2,3-dioxygenase subunit alpha
VRIEDLIDDRPQEGRFRVHRSAMTSAEIFERERAMIFDRSWLYIGHDTEIPNAGDYRRRLVAGRPLFLLRGSDGTVRAFFNTCTHRGAQICRPDEGRAQSFQCFYHAWTFNTLGELAGVPEEEAYGEHFDRGPYALKSPPRLENYRGFYFVSFDPAIDDLTTYLGAAADLIDLTMDSAEVLGGWTILHGVAKYSIKANWKLLVENSYDGYHLPTVHQTYLEYVAWRRAKNGKTGTAPGSGLQNAYALPGGHGSMLHEAPGRGIANPSPLWDDGTNEEVERIKAENISRFGEQRGREMCEISRHLLIFPNLAFQDSQSGFRLRQIWPVAPDLIDVLQWDFVPRNERADLRASRMESSLAFLGPGGLATPDDVEALESCQLGFAAEHVEWSDISRGMLRTSQPRMHDELQMRSFWRQWHSSMQGHGRAPFTDDRERRVEAAR